jgi:hypothetical protein
MTNAGKKVETSMPSGLCNLERPLPLASDGQAIELAGEAIQPANAELLLAFHPVQMKSEP